MDSSDWMHEQVSPDSKMIPGIVLHNEGRYPALRGINLTQERIQSMSSIRKAAAFAGTAAITAGIVFSVGVHATPNQTPAPAGKIAPWEAMKIAVKKAPGSRALNANFEFDEGHWVYGVFVVKGKTLQEVEIDPMTGKVGDVEKITPDGEAKEVRQELMAAIGGGKAKSERAEEKE